MGKRCELFGSDSNDEEEAALRSLRKALCAASEMLFRQEAGLQQALI